MRCCLEVEFYQSDHSGEKTVLKGSERRFISGLLVDPDAHLLAIDWVLASKGRIGIAWRRLHREISALCLWF